jgi:hypothetical protein
MVDGELPQSLSDPSSTHPVRGGEALHPDSEDPGRSAVPSQVQKPAICSPPSGSSYEPTELGHQELRTSDAMRVRMSVVRRQLPASHPFWTAPTKPYRSIGTTSGASPTRMCALYGLVRRSTKALLCQNPGQNGIGFKAVFFGVECFSLSPALSASKGTFHFLSIALRSISGPLPARRRPGR